MDFGLTEEQVELAGLTRKILAERDAPWGDLAAAGVLAAGLPLSLGGAGLGLLEQCSVLIELGRAASDVPYLASIVLGAGALASFGTQAQREQWAAAGRGSRIERAHRAALILTFGGGTNEVQRDIIAAAGLGLPFSRR